MSQTFLWVSKFDVKLGVVVKNFKITAGRWLFFFFVKKFAFETHVLSVILKIIQKRYKRTVKSLQSPSGVERRIYTTRPKAEFDVTGWTGWTCGRVDGWTGWRSRKVSFKFLHTLWVYRLCIYLLVYKIKIVTNILMGLKIWCQVGGAGKNFQNHYR